MSLEQNQTTEQEHAQEEPCDYCGLVPAVCHVTLAECLADVPLCAACLKNLTNLEVPSERTPL